MTALGKLMALFPGGGKKKKKRSGRHSVPHALVHLDVVVRRGRWGQGYWLFPFFPTSQLDQRVISSADMSNTALQKSRIKVNDISQQSLQRNKINVQSGVFIKGSTVLRS